MKEKMAIQLISKTVLQGFEIIVAFFKLKYLWASEFGLIVFASVIANFFTMFLDIGVTAIHFQNTSRKDFNSYFGSYFLLKTILLLVNYSLPFVYLIFSSDDSFTKTLIYISVFAGIANAFAQIFNVNLQVRMKFFKIEVPTLISRVVANLVSLYIIFLFASLAISVEDTILWLCLVPLLASIIILVTSVFLNFSEEIFSKPKTPLIKEYLINAKPFIIQSISSVVNSYLGYVLLANAFGNANLTYYYIVQNYIITFLMTLSVSSAPLFDSLFPRLLAENNSEEVSNACKKFEKYASIFYIFTTVFVFLYSDKMFGIFLPGYRDSVPFLKGMIFIPFLDGILRPYWGILYQGKKNKLSASISIINIGVSLVLEIVLIPDQLFGIPMCGLGGWGFVILSWILTIEQLLVFRYFAKKMFNIKPYGWKILLHLIIGLISFLLVYMLNIFVFEALFEDSFIYFFILSIGTFLAFYLLGLIATKELTKKDYKYIIELLKPSTYIKSFKKELQ